MTMRARQDEGLGRRLLVIAVAGVSVALLAACGSGSGSGSGSGRLATATTSGAAGDSAGNETAYNGTPLQLDVDPCTLVTKAEAEEVLGAAVAQGSGDDGHICTYTANGSGGTVTVNEQAPDFCKLLFLALEKDIFGGVQVRIDAGDGGMQVTGGGNVQVVVDGGCLEVEGSKGDGKVDDATILALTKVAIERVRGAATGDQTSTTVNSAAGAGSGTPSRKPCDLLSKKIAEDALDVPVGDPKDFPGQGNETCAYTTADGTGQVLLTTYAVKGTTAALDQAATQFTNAYAVDGVGDAARVSLEDHAIGVLTGDFVFGMALVLPGSDQDVTPVTEAQLVKLANAVLAEL